MQAVGKKFMMQIEVVVGELGAGPGVVAAAVAIDELLILAGAGKGFGAEKQHMLQKMGHSLTLRRIGKMTAFNRH